MMTTTEVIAFLKTTRHALRLDAVRTPGNGYLFDPVVLGRMDGGVEQLDGPVLTTVSLPYPRLLKPGFSHCEQCYSLPRHQPKLPLYARIPLHGHIWMYMIDRDMTTLYLRHCWRFATTALISWGLAEDGQSNPHPSDTSFKFNNMQKHIDTWFCPKVATFAKIASLLRICLAKAIG